jgi:hypothetical protein
MSDESEWTKPPSAGPPDAPNELITAYPLVLVPVFGVPLAVLLH